MGRITVETGLITGEYSTWDLRWPNWHWDRFLSWVLWFTLSVSFHQGSSLTNWQQY